MKTESFQYTIELYLNPVEIDYSLFPCCRDPSNHSETMLITTFLDSTLGLFLASSYILNYPISVKQSFTMRLWPTGKVLVSVSGSYMALP